MGNTPSGLTAKNLDVLRRFDDPALLRKLLLLPDVLAAQARTGRLTLQRRVQKMQIALAIQLLLAAPMRMQNLATLRLDRQLQWPSGRGGPVFIVLRGSETKNALALEYPLEGRSRDFLHDYLDHWRKYVTAPDSPWLFARLNGDPVPVSALRDGIVKALRRELGIAMTPHQFRHLAAKLMLDANPGRDRPGQGPVGAPQHQDHARLLCGNAHAGGSARVRPDPRTRAARSGNHRELKRCRTESVSSSTTGLQLIGRGGSAQRRRSTSSTMPRWPRIGLRRPALTRNMRTAAGSRSKRRTAPGTVNGALAERITQEALRRYVEALAARIVPMSVAAELGHLILAFAALAPTLDLSWLRAWQARWQRDAQPREKRNQIVHGGRLLALGLKLMDQAAGEATPAEQARSYRDGLLIALLATVPLRRRTLAGLRIDRNLFAVGTGYVLAVAHAETKSGQPLEFPLPKRLSPYMARYLEQYRLMFAGADQHPYLWTSPRGGALGAEAIYDIVCRRTTVEFGVADLPASVPHDIAATTLARDAPNQLLTARDLLGHTNLTTTDQHYRQSQTIEATRQHGRLLDSCWQKSRHTDGPSLIQSSALLAVQMLLLALG